MKHLWRSLEDDRDVSASYAARHPDAVYDAADPDWWDILYEEEIVEDVPDDGIDDGDVEEIIEVDDDFDDEPDYTPEDVVDEYDWDYGDDEYYEVEIGIDYEP